MRWRSRTSPFVALPSAPLTQVDSEEWQQQLAEKHFSTGGWKLQEGIYIVRRISKVGLYLRVDLLLYYTCAAQRCAVPCFAVPCRVVCCCDVLCVLY